MSTMDKIKAKVDNVLHKDKTHSDPTGPHDSHAANKADPRVDSDRIGTAGNTSGAGGVGAGQYTGSSTHTGAHTGTHGTHGTTGVHGSDPTGPHDSHLANKLDPRVDSDRVGTAGNTSGAGGYGAGQYGSSTHTGTTGTGLTGSHGTHGTHGSDPTGPHDSHLANKLDPRVDSDRYGAAGNTAGAGGVGGGQYTGATHGTTHGSGLTGSHGTTHGSGLTGTHGTTGYGSDPTGPHDSHLANKADPRVDSDRYGTAGNTAGAGGIGGGQYTGTGTHTGTTGGLTGTHGTHGTHGATGNVGSGNSTTAGPHNSNLLNKLDPRVDSDLDGSKTVGGNQTYR